MTDAILGQIEGLIPNIPLTVVSQGAEALVLSTDVHPYIPKKSKLVVKFRPSKPYRHPKIDAMITKSRTIGEAKFMAKLARVSIPAPALVLLDAPNGIIWMESIGDELANGTISSLKNWLWHLEKSGEDCISDHVQALLQNTGLVIGKLHMNDMIHGDLTTSNIILQGGQAYLIDFGLSSYSTLAEDKAVDLYVMERAVDSTHSDFAEKYNGWLLDGYKQTLCGEYGGKGGKKKYADTIKKLEDVRLRGRKRSMLG
ncbi:CIC11C00000002201 [Sungouiella intermedia]|uniref:EKC/KEOPS complex subunit BUD32 n=1 Tax=Sungouiella intermedia TaxID=45354 RepID=A0A1L0FSC2_9ASCO|nr:CIC11C00000002201 [[Candida] intermedia]